MKKLTFALGLGTLFVSNTYASKLSYENNFLVNQNQTESATLNWVGIQLDTSGEVLTFKGVVDASAKFRIDSNDLSYSLKSLYIEKELEKSRLSIGKQVLDWNPDQKFWDLNTINPRENFSLMDEELEGLVGVQYERKMGSFRLNLFGSFLYVPELNPGLTVKDGQITSSTSWGKLPPKYTEVTGRLVPISYQLNMPDIRDIILKKSLGLKLDYNWKSGMLSGYALYKPQNNLLINAEAAYNSVSDAVEVEANPIVNHHAVYGVRLDQNFGDVHWTSSLETQDPQASIGDLDVLDPLTFERKNKNFSSEYFEINPVYDWVGYFTSSVSITKPKYEVSLNYIKLITDPYESDDFYSDGAKWRNAVGASIRYYFSDTSYVTGKVRHDFEMHDNLFNGEFSFNLLKKMNVTVGYEFIKSPNDSSYWSAFRTKDILYSKISYDL